MPRSCGLMRPSGRTAVASVRTNPAPAPLDQYGAAHLLKIADSAVDPKFGTGVIKVTPGHDATDFEIGRRHGLPMPTILDESGVVTGTGTRFDGMDRFAARVAVREALAAEGRIVAEKRPYRHSVGHSSRAPYEPIEPRLSLQWFVKVEPLAAPSLAPFMTARDAPRVAFSELIEREDIRPAPYVGRYKWVMLDRLDAVSDAELEELIQRSYAMVAAKAPKRLKSTAHPPPKKKRRSAKTSKKRSSAKRKLR